MDPSLFEREEREQLQSTCKRVRQVLAENIVRIDEALCTLAEGSRGTSSPLDPRSQLLSHVDELVSAGLKEIAQLFWSGQRTGYYDLAQAAGEAVTILMAQRAFAEAMLKRGALKGSWAIGDFVEAEGRLVLAELDQLVTSPDEHMFKERLFPLMRTKAVRLAAIGYAHSRCREILTECCSAYCCRRSTERWELPESTFFLDPLYFDVEYMKATRAPGGQGRHRAPRRTTEHELQRYSRRK